MLLGEAQENIAERLIVAHRAVAGAFVAFFRVEPTLGAVCAGPQGLFVELDAFLRRAAEDHRAHPPVADGQSLQPVGGGFVIPEKISG